MPSALDAFIFIDANVYLDFYKIPSGKKLLTSLLEQRDHIFVTTQVVDEVTRNKLNVAANSLEKHFAKIQLPGLPDQLFDVLEGAAGDLREKHIAVRQMIDPINGVFKTAAEQILKRVSRSEDELSRALGGLFATAIGHTPEELQRARDRRERGNPPGKKADPLGDQLTWEQLLTYSNKKAKVWIISRDSDYSTAANGKMLLNPLLYRFVRKNRGLIRVRAACQVSDRVPVRALGRCEIRRIFSW